MKYNCQGEKEAVLRAIILNMSEAAAGTSVQGKKGYRQKGGELYFCKDEENICALCELKKFPEEILLSFPHPPFTMVQ